MVFSLREEEAQVPYTLSDEEIPDDWECMDNVWDPHHAACTVPQALTDEEIDEILAQQARCSLLILNI